MPGSNKFVDLAIWIMEHIIQYEKLYGEILQTPKGKEKPSLQPGVCG
jgi:hypothetical protein